MSNFISNAFNGSTKDLIMAALGNHKATKEELNEIKNLISQIENKK
jgi:predicted transcriptional regulator